MGDEEGVIRGAAVFSGVPNGLEAGVAAAGDDIEPVALEEVTPVALVDEVTPVVVALVAPTLISANRGAGTP